MLDPRQGPFVNLVSWPDEAAQHDLGSHWVESFAEQCVSVRRLFLANVLSGHGYLMLGMIRERADFAYRSILL